MADPLAQAVIVSITPSSAVQGGSAVVTITGDKTNFGVSSAVSFSGGGITADPVTPISATVLQATLAIDLAAQAGLSDVRVTTGAQVATAWACSPCSWRRRDDLCQPQHRDARHR